MGCTYEFKCKNCQYVARVSGDDDCGFMAATTTILCEDCRELYDVVVSKRPWDEKSRREPRCFKNKKHKVRKWKHPDICPKCGSYMEKGELILFWD